MHRKPSLWLALFALAIVPVLFSVPARAQDTGKIHGHVQDPATTPMANAIVELSTDGKTALYTFTTDANGDYTGGGIKPGEYVVTLFQSKGKAVDRFMNVKVTAGGDTQQDFDLSRPEYLKKLPEAERKMIEETKAKNAQIEKENKGIGKLNTMLKQARADNQAKKFDEAAALMQQAVVLKPDASVLWLELGIAQTGLKKYPDAQTALQKVLDLEKASAKPKPELQAAANNELGEVYANTNKIPEATAAYDEAAKLQPSNAGMYYTNETIILSRTGETDATVAAADKAIAADPNKAIAYYLKGQALVAKSTVDPKTQRIVAPPGTADAYKKYLELAPNGPMAPEAKAVLDQIGEKISSSYTAKPKRH